MYWYLKVFKDFANFEGRARRKEYWMFTLFNIIILWALMSVFFVALLIIKEYAFLLIIPFFIYILIMIVPSIAVTVRRLHDINQSGLWYLISFIPFGGYVLLVFTILDSTPGPNKYGPNPKEVYN